MEELRPRQEFDPNKHKVTFIIIITATVRTASKMKGS